jgi:probable HAF family extracellular repeat protein
MRKVAGQLSLTHGAALSVRFHLIRRALNLQKPSLTEEKIMKITHRSKIQSWILAAALSIGLGFVSPVSAEITHAYIVDSNGKGLTELGTLGGDSSYALGINDAGQVVGSSYTAAGAWHAFITGPNGGGMTDLNSLVSLPRGAALTEANGINNHGQVAVAGSLIPEPKTYAMLLAGLGLLGFIARRRKTA